VPSKLSSDYTRVWTTLQVYILFFGGQAGTVVPSSLGRSVLGCLFQELILMAAGDKKTPAHTNGGAVVMDPAIL